MKLNCAENQELSNGLDFGRVAHNHPVTLRVPPLLEKEGRNVLPASHEAGWRRRRRGGVGCSRATVICQASPLVLPYH